MSPGREAGEHDATAATARALGLEPESLDGAPLEPDALAEAWEQLDACERAVLSTLAELGGAAPASLLVAELVAASAEDLDEGLPEHEATAAVAASEALDSLWARGLAQRDRATRDAWLVPALEAALLRRRVAELAELLEAVEPPPPDPDEHLLLCALSIVRRDPVALTRAGRPHRRTLDRLQGGLSALIPEDGAEALVGELRRQGLVRLADGSLRVDESAASEWASLDARERALRFLESEWSSPDALLLLRQLRVLPGLRWPAALSARSLRRLLSRLREDDPKEASPRHERAVAALVSAGLVARRRADESLALTGLGRSWPRGLEAPPRPTGVLIGNDLAVLVPRGLVPSVHLRVARAASLESGDVVARYRLDRESVLAALDAGEHAQDLLAFLETRAEPALPDGVREDLRRWCERFGEVTAHVGIAVVCEVAGRREEFGALVDRSSLATRLLAPGVAIVAPSDHEALLVELGEAGFTPRRRVLEPRPVALRKSAVPPPLHALQARAEAGLDWATLPCWSAPGEGGRGRRATPPAGTALARMKAKYRREFGRSELSALDALEVEELLEMEERGLVRRYLSGVDGSSRSDRLTVELGDHEGSELVPTSPRRAAAVLQRCAEGARRCELAWRGEAGRRTVASVLPLTLLEEAGIRYVRLRLVTGGEERLVALDRVLALRVISPQR